MAIRVSVSGGAISAVSPHSKRDTSRFSRFLILHAGVSDVMTSIADDVNSIGTIRQAQVRQARWIAQGGIVPAYNAVMALGQGRLREAVRTHDGPESSRELAEDTLDAYLECGAGLELMVTNMHVLHAERESKGLKWWVAVRDVETIEVSESQIVIAIRGAPPRTVNCTAGGPSARDLCEQLKQAIKATR